MNLEGIERLTPVLVNQGHRVFQAHRFAAGDSGHARRLAAWADLPVNARVVDLGSGIGEIARLFSIARPDLSFCLVNLSSVQMAYAEPEHERHICDFRAVPEPDGSFDAAMFMFSIGHEAACEGLKEAARLLRPGGVLFIVDMVRIAGDNSQMHEAVEYEVNSRQAMEDTARVYDFRLDFYLEPSDDGSYGRGVLGPDFDHIFAGTIPAVWRFIRKGA